MNQENFADLSKQQLVYLRWGLVECFDSSELAALCFDLDVDYDQIKGSGLEEKARELVGYLKRRSQLKELIEFCQRVRPNYIWEQKGETQTLTPELAEWQRRKQREAEVISGLRNERLPAYKALWALLEPMAKYARPKPFTLIEATNLSDAMRHWYFQVGGIYLSERCRKTYFALQGALQSLIEDQSLKLGPNNALAEDTFEDLRLKGSDLRATMAEDLGTRR